MSWTRTLFALSLGVLAAVVIKAAEESPPNTGMADSAALITAFDRFAGSADPNDLVLSLSNLRGLSAEAPNAGGSVRIDLATGVITSTLQLMPTERTFELWLFDNQPGDRHTTLADSGDVLKEVGTYVLASGRHRLSVSLAPEFFSGFYPDRAFVIPSDGDPVEGFVLTGSATFFARLRHRQVRFVDDPGATRGFDPEANDFTVDPELIAALPSSDPLFCNSPPARGALEPCRSGHPAAFVTQLSQSQGQS